MVKGTFGRKTTQRQTRHISLNYTSSKLLDPACTGHPESKWSITTPSNSAVNIDLQTAIQ